MMMGECRHRYVLKGGQIVTEKYRIETIQERLPAAAAAPMHCVPAPAVRSEAPRNRAQAVDVISRIMFPLLYLVFNIIYWPLYVL